MNMLTDRARDTYTFIRDYFAEHGVAPKLREIAAHLGIQSRGTVHRYLRSLADAGLIAVEAERARGIRLLQDDVPGQSGESKLTLPLLGRIVAGRPLEAVPDGESVDLSTFFMGPNRFLLRVQGDSMIDDGILDGDLVVIEKREIAADGEIVVALIDEDQATLKRLQRNRDGSVTLRPSNPAMAPMRYAGERVRVQGVVVAQLRSYR
jgi:repressor LexA